MEWVLDSLKFLGPLAGVFLTLFAGFWWGRRERRGGWVEGKSDGTADEHDRQQAALQAANAALSATDAVLERNAMRELDRIADVHQEAVSRRPTEAEVNALIRDSKK